MRPQLPQKPVGIAPRQTFFGQHMARKIGGVEGDNRIRPRRNRHRQNMAVIVIGQRQARLDRRARRTAGCGKFRPQPLRALLKRAQLPRLGKAMDQV
ncbi:MAG: hypothetical protein RLZZ413_2125 [Pseudomonadota bacterium]